MTITKKIQPTNYHQILHELLLETVVLTYVLKNVDTSNDLRVSERDVGCRMVAFKIYVFEALLLEKHHIEAIPRFRNHFYHKLFLQYFEGCPRVFSFHLNNLDNEEGNELQS